MSNPSGPSKTRTARNAAQVMSTGSASRFMGAMRRVDVIYKLGATVLASLLLCIIVQGWNPPFVYKKDTSLPRDVPAVVAFSEVSVEETEFARKRATREVRHVYQNDSGQLVQLREMLHNHLRNVLSADSYETVDQEAWRKFFPAADADCPSSEVMEIQFELLRKSFESDEDHESFQQALTEVMQPFEQRGLITELQHDSMHGNQLEIEVHQVDQPGKRSIVPIQDALIGNASAIHEALRQNLVSGDLADRAFDWLRPQLTDTLLEDKGATLKAATDAADAIQPVIIQYEVGQTLVKADKPLTENDVRLLWGEYLAAIDARSTLDKIARATVMIGLFFSLFVLAATFMFRHSPLLLLDRHRMIQFLVLAVVTVISERILFRVAPDIGQTGLIPILVFAQIVTIATNRDLGLALTGLVVFVVTLSGGQGLGQLIILTGTSGLVVFQLNRIRSRSKLIKIGLYAGVGAILLTLAVDVIWGQDLSLVLIGRALMNGLWTLCAGFLMTGLLPFIERPFGILTDVSLLELTDVSHPLLHELVRRAPATYAHSILVGSIAERAAEAIGARGLHVRVGAYFHDIGKILKPAYYYENQPPGDNRHASLVPQMSTLVIIAHVKDGADLARQHKLPQPIIDLIEQHHGTTLVQYFYGLANEQQRQESPGGHDLEESTYRYPGPRPQSKEAAVLMLSDTAESACRSIDEPSQQRIDSLVRHVTKQKLQDGQFDDSGMTLRDIRTVEDSLIKSLIANYHGRIKYPDQNASASSTDSDSDNGDGSNGN